MPHTEIKVLMDTEKLNEIAGDFIDCLACGQPAQVRYNGPMTKAIFFHVFTTDCNLEVLI